MNTRIDYFEGATGYMTEKAAKVADLAPVAPRFYIARATFRNASCIVSPKNVKRLKLLQIKEVC